MTLMVPRLASRPDGVERRVAGEAVQPIGVAAHAAVPQHQPLRLPGAPAPAAEEQPGPEAAAAAIFRLRSAQSHWEALSDSPGRCSTTTSHHPGPGASRAR